LKTKEKHMKSPKIPWLPCLAAASLAVSCLSAQSLAGELPHAVKFELGKSEFAPGDSITIQQVRGTSEVIKVGETYSVDGTYELASHDGADLAFYATTIGAGGPTPVDPQQQIKVKKGSGSFHLVKTMDEDGYLHVSYYPLESGSGFGGVYFGQGDRVLRGWSQSGSVPASASNPNRGLLEYLGQPVAPSASLDARYTKEGLTNAIQTAARNAGITVKNLAIEDGEFPFLVGVTCAGSDFVKLKEQLRKLDGYDYSGSIGNDVSRNGSDTCNVFSLVPYSAYPAGTDQPIYHRLGLMQQVFYDRIVGRR
jgi:hypothetical protein